MAFYHIGYAKRIIGYFAGAAIIAAIFNPFTLEPTQWLKGYGVADITTNAANALIVGSPCTIWNGTAYLTVVGLGTNVTVVSKQGTSNVSIVTNRISFTAGTCWDLLLSNGSHYSMSDLSADRCHDDVNGMHGIITSGTIPVIWGATQDAYHYCAENGGSRVMTFDATGDTIKVRNNLPFGFYGDQHTNLKSLCYRTASASSAVNFAAF